MNINLYNPVTGSLVIVTCLTGYWYSWKLQAKDNLKNALFLLLVCGFMLRLYTSSDFFLHFWDERYHALVAKHLMHHPLTPMLYEDPVLPYDCTQWTTNHIWLHKQPLSLWVMAASMQLFGVNEIALRLPSVILTSIGILLTYVIGKYFYNERTGYIAALLYSINGFIIDLASGREATDHVDIFFLFFIELAIFFSIIYARKGKPVYTILTGISIGAAILSKWLPALIVLPIWFLILAATKKFSIKTILVQFALLTTTILVIVLPWQLYIFHAFPTEAHWEAAYNSKHFTCVLEGHDRPFYYYFDEIRVSYGDLLYLPMLWFFWKIYKHPKDLKQWAVCIWILVPCIIFSFAQTKMPGYVLFTAPALFIITGAFWVSLSEKTAEEKTKWAINVLQILLIALPARYAIERIKPFNKMGRQPEWVSDLKKLNDQKIQKGILFNYNAPIEAMFYTNLTAYPSIPDESVIRSLMQKGYIVLINDNGNIPGGLRTIKNVRLIKLTMPYKANQ